MNFYLNLFGVLIFLITIPIFFIFCVKLIISLIKKTPFPKKMLIASLTGIIVVFALIGYTRYFFTFDNLEGEFYKGPVDSPTERYTANAYYQTYGGAAGGVNVWVEITYHDENDKVKTVHFSDAKSNFSMEWKDKDTLYLIRGEKTPSSRNESGIAH